MKEKPRRFEIEFYMDVPNDFDLTDLREHIQTAVNSYSGGLHPEDSMFGNRTFDIDLISEPNTKGELE